MPGTLVSDALAPVLRDGTAITSATTTTGSWVAVAHPHDVQIELVQGTTAGSSIVTSTRIEGADDTSANGLVSYGTFATDIDEDSDGAVRRLNAKVYKPYMRAVVVTAGTVTSLPLTITVRQPHYQRTASTTA